MKKIITVSMLFISFIGLAACSSNQSKDTNTLVSSKEKTYETKELSESDLSNSFVGQTKTHVLEKLGKPHKVWSNDVTNTVLKDVVDGNKTLYTLNSTLGKDKEAKNYETLYSTGQELLNKNIKTEAMQYNLFINDQPSTPKSSFFVWIDKSDDKVVYEGHRALIDDNGNYVQ